MYNKKVRNATVIECDGIRFRSILEHKVYVELRDAGYEPEYESEKIVLLDTFEPEHTWYLDGEPQVTKKGNNKKIVGKTYTPDFKLTVNFTDYYIEVKGHPNDVYTTTRKMFLKWLDSQDNKIFVEIHSVKGIRQFINVLREKKNNEGKENI